MPMPYIPILIELRSEIAAALAGRQLRSKDITVRHHRHRDSRSNEIPCVEIVFVSADPSQTFGRQTTNGGVPEEVWELSVDLVVVLDLPAEADDPASVADDAVGVGDHAQVVEWILDRLFPDLETGAEPNDLGGKIWQMRYDGTAPDEADATPDHTRLGERLTLFYRVRSDRPQLLLENQ